MTEKEKEPVVEDEPVPEEHPGEEQSGTAYDDSGEEE